MFRNKLSEQDFAGFISVRASKVLGPISRYRVADILTHVKQVSRASRFVLTVGVHRIVCNVLCTAQRFHTEGSDQMCLVGCPNELDSLTTTNAVFCTICSFLGVILMCLFHLLQDLTTPVFLRSLQCGREEQAYCQNWWQSSSSSWWQWKILGGIPHLRRHRDDGPSTDGAGELAKIVNGLFTCGMSLKLIWCKSYSGKIR